jgi:hypothetical protein
MKNTVNEVGFPLVTHTVDSDARFGSYGILKSRQGAEQILDRLDRRANNQIFKHINARILTRVANKFHRSLTRLSNAYSYTHFQ